MKNLFIALTLMLIGTSTFANNREIEPLDKDVVVQYLEVQPALQLEDEMMACFDFILSCGVRGTACGDSVGKLVELIWYVDGVICG